MATNKLALLKRKEKDVYKLRSSKYKFEETQNQSTFQVEFCGNFLLNAGPQQTPYQLGKWKINLYLPDEYPYKSPSVGFLNRIYHPNIDFTSGSVCLDVINQTWTPMYQLLNIFQVNPLITQVFLPQLLTYPNPSSPLNQEAANLYESSQQKYKQKVMQYITKYALNNELMQERKKKEEIKLAESKKMQELEKQKQKDKNKQKDGKLQKIVDVDDGSMEDEGSSMSQRNSIFEDEELKNF